MNDTDLKAYLTSVVGRDIQLNNVHPKSDVRDRIAAEIQKKSGCSETSFVDPQTVASRQFRIFILAGRGRFVDDTIQAIEDVSRYLKQERATRFELLVENRQAPNTPAPENNLFGDVILVGVRYLIP